MPPSSSRDRNVEDTYESQNDQRLDDLHSKIRTLRGVRLQTYPATPSGNSLPRLGNDRHPQGRRIPESAPRRIGAHVPFCGFPGPGVSFTSGDQGNAFSSFTSSLSDSARRANQAFGLGIHHHPAPRRLCLPFQTGPGTPKQYRILVYSVGSMLSLWLLWKVLSWLFFGSSPEPVPAGESYGT